VPDLSFQIESAEVAEFSAAPQITFKLRVSNADAAQAIQAVTLRCQIQIEVTRRRYASRDQEALRDLYGEPSRWNQTLRNLLWTHITTNLPPFQGSTLADLAVPCTFDFNIAATKYFYALGDGEVPLCFQFSGTVFYSGPGGSMLAAPISWDKEARFSLPVKTWRDMMDHYHPNQAWLCLRREVFDRLYDYKVSRGVPTWEEALEDLLDSRIGDSVRT
jgi:hypothetical protein